MNLEIRSFVDMGDMEKERVVLKVLADLDVGDFAMFRGPAGNSGKSPTSGRKKAYWFPDLMAKANDLVVLYTKRGSRRSKPMEGGYTAHFLYWNSEEPLWNDPKVGAVLLHVSEWEFKIPTPAPTISE